MYLTPFENPRGYFKIFEPCICAGAKERLIDLDMLSGNLLDWHPVPRVAWPGHHRHEVREIEVIGRHILSIRVGINPLVRSVDAAGQELVYFFVGLEECELGADLYAHVGDRPALRQRHLA